MNNIPQELLDKWQREAEDNIDTPFVDSYIQGRLDEYLSMQAEIQRLKGLIQKAYYKGLDDDYMEQSFSDFKTEHNL